MSWNNFYVDKIKEQKSFNDLFETSYLLIKLEYLTCFDILQLN